MFELLRFFWQTYSVPTVLSVIIGYLLGSINFSIIITHFVLHRDIRDFGSGNAGATNVLRSVGKWPALLTFVGDFSKQVASIVIAKAIFLAFAEQNNLVSGAAAAAYAVYLAGTSCFYGHIFPLYFKFRGGKGVITAFAMMALIDPRVFAVEIVIFAIVLLAKRIVSLASIICGLMYPIVTFAVTYLIDYRQFLLGNQDGHTIYYVIIATSITFLVGTVLVLRHRSNIVRLLNGTEKPIRAKK